MHERDFLRLTRENDQLINKLISFYINDAEEKRDLKQDILLNAWKGVNGFKGESKFSTWLYRICINTILTRRRKKNVMDGHKELKYAISVNPIETKDESQQLHYAITQLNEIERAIISLHLDGYENEEISDMIGISLNNTGVKLHRIKKKIFEILKKI